MLGVAALSTVGLARATSLGLVPSALLGLFLGLALPHLAVGRMGKRRVAASRPYSRMPST